MKRIGFNGTITEFIDWINDICGHCYDGMTITEMTKKRYELCNNLYKKTRKMK